MHERPAHAWTLEELARAAGLSRTAFAQSFKRVVGETPMAYLTRWRMTLATHKLREKGQTLGTVAFDIGYESQSAFCAAFRRFFGTSPKRFVVAKGFDQSDES